MADAALSNDIPVHTVNPDDFDKIPGLRVVPATHIDQPATDRSSQMPMFPWLLVLR